MKENKLNTFSEEGKIYLKCSHEILDKIKNEKNIKFICIIIQHCWLLED